VSLVPQTKIFLTDYSAYELPQKLQLFTQMHKYQSLSPDLK
jgi:hypothetical protein